MKFTLPKIYPITDRRISGLSHIGQVQRLIDGGATLIQIRDKDAAGGEFYTAAVEAIEYARSRGVTIIVNDRVDIGMASGADGVHLGQDDLPPEHARKLLGDNAIIGFSTHSVEQALDAIKLPVDYIAIGPIFRPTPRAKRCRAFSSRCYRRDRSVHGGPGIIGRSRLGRDHLRPASRGGRDPAENGRIQRVKLNIVGIWPKKDIAI